VTAPGRLELFGHSSFVGQLSEVGTIPVGCYLTSGCHIAATIIAGRTTVATAAPQAFRASGSGQLYYRLNRWGQRLLLRSHVSKLPVRVTITDASGATAHAKMALIPFATSGRGPARQLNPNSAVSAAGGTDFVTGGAGGIIARCGTVGACQITATLSYGRLKLATSRPTMIGGLQLGYVFYSLTARGRQMLKQAKGNQLAVNLTLRSGTSVATARLALVQF
jgi:hypothetical protein